MHLVGGGGAASARRRSRREGEQPAASGGRQRRGSHDHRPGAGDRDRVERHGERAAHLGRGAELRADDGDGPGGAGDRCAGRAPRAAGSSSISPASASSPPTTRSSGSNRLHTPAAATPRWCPASAMTRRHPASPASARAMTSRSVRLPWLGRSMSSSTGAPDVHLQAAAVPAAADGALVVDRRVPDLARGADAAVEHLAAEHEPAADAVRGAHVDDVLLAAGGAEADLRERAEVGVVVDVHRQAEPLAEQLRAPRHRPSRAACRARRAGRCARRPGPGRRRRRPAPRTGWRRPSRPSRSGAARPARAPGRRGGRAAAACAARRRCGARRRTGPRAASGCRSACRRRGRGCGRASPAARGDRCARWGPCAGRRRSSAP